MRMRNWTWIFGQSNALGRMLNRPRLRARTDQKINLPMVVIFGVGIGVYTFQPALKEAAEIVQQGDKQQRSQSGDSAMENKD